MKRHRFKDTLYQIYSGEPYDMALVSEALQIMMRVESQELQIIYRNPNTKVLHVMSECETGLYNKRQCWRMLINSAKLDDK